MIKYKNIAISLVVTTLLFTNFYLLYEKEGVAQESIRVSEYERLKLGDYFDRLAKESLVVPDEIYTVYAEQDDSVEEWLVKEGDIVMAGQELALLNMEQVNNYQETLEIEYDSLVQQEVELFEVLTNLENSQYESETISGEGVNTNNSFHDTEGLTTFNLGVDANFQVDVSQEGSYAAAISSVEQQLSEIHRKIMVIETQLNQGVEQAALISPTDGVVSTVHRMGERLAVDVYGSQRQVITYAIDSEWQDIYPGARVLLQGKGIEETEEGTVLSVSEVHSNTNELLNTYKALDSTDPLNPLAYYEVIIEPDNQLDTLPFAHNINALIYKEEFYDEVSMNESWLHDKNNEDETAIVSILNEDGQANEVLATTPLTLKKRAIITGGLYEGEVVIPQSLTPFDYDPRVIMPMPQYMPTKKELRAFGVRNYLRYMIIR